MGSMWLRHEGVSIQVEWPGGAMELNRFAKVVNAIKDTYEATTGILARNVPASALTYESGEEEG